MYGIVDAALEVARFDRDVHPVRIQSGDLQASRLGLRGREDLGGGLGAEFDLEMGPSLDTGAGGAVLWNRGAMVGLTSAYGRVDAGKQYMPLFWIAIRSEAGTYGFSNMSALLNTEHAAATGHTGVGGYYDNVLRYRSGDFHGFDAELAYSTGNELPGPARHDAVASGCNLHYTDGPWWLGAGYNNYTAHDAGSGADQVQRSSLVGGKYSASAFAIGASYLRTSNMQGGPNAGDARAAQLTGRLPMGLWDLNAGLARLREDAGRRSWSAHVGIVYFLSRRTQLYGYVSEVRNNAAGTAGLANLSSDYRVVTPGFSPSALALGIRQSF